MSLGKNPLIPEGDSALAAISVPPIHPVLIRNLSSVRCSVKLMRYNLEKGMPINKGRDISLSLCDVLSSQPSTAVGREEDELGGRAEWDARRWEGKFGMK